MDKTKFDKIFTSKKIGNINIKNRLVMAPMGTGAMQNPRGEFSERIKHYYEARAKGGIGLIITNATLMTRVGGLDKYIMGLIPVFLDNTYIGPASELCEVVHHYGSKIAIQLTPGLGRIDQFWDEKPVAPSELETVFNPELTTRALSTSEVEKIVEDYKKVSNAVKKAGFDAIEIHGYGGYLMDQFMTDIWNNREDKYGGSLENRLRFPIEVIEAVREGTGRELPIIFKFTPHHNFEGGRGLEEGIQIARRLESSGVDCLHVDKGAYESWWHTIPPVQMPVANQIELVHRIKKEVEVPVIGHGKLGVKPKITEEVLSEGKTDFVALGRTLLADSKWPSKIKERNISNIRHCINCQECLKRIFEGKPIGCAVNPKTGREIEYQLKPSNKAKKVLVIGGGPAGMEAARVAAKRNHDVTLFEEDMKLGGLVRIGSKPSFKEEMKGILEYYQSQLQKEEVSLNLGTKVDLEMIKQAEPDVLINATGGEPIIPSKITGVGRDNVFTAEEVLEEEMGREKLGDKIIICGGGEVGCEIALHFKNLDKKMSVTIVEMLDSLAHDSFINIKWCLEDLLEKNDIKVMLNSEMREIREDRAIIDVEGSKEEIPVDSVILASGYESKDDWKSTFKDEPYEFYTIGDAKKPRNIIDAIWEGFHTSRLI